MAIRDIEAFVRERAARFDPNLDLTPGSPYDTQVIQPLVRRLGTDPFTVDLSAFLDARLRQAFPDMALDEGDALTDLLVKPNTLLWDPIVREINRVKQNLSFKDPTVLSLDEAESLGANLFAERRTGSFSRGVGRIFFAQPQNISISPVNFCTSQTGLRFFPTEIQAIQTSEMLVNQASDGTYYFDINLVAESPGSDYNININELSSVANIESAVRVTNLRRFRDGTDAETSSEYIDRAKGELTERSLVTLRGISAQLTRAFPEIRRLNVVGFNDPEMERDVIKGGGLGPVIASGQLGTVGDDGENRATSRRFVTAEASFITLIGPSALPVSGFVLTVLSGTDDLSDPVAQDYMVRAVVDNNTIDLVEQKLSINKANLAWMLRKKELTLSGIPGGILFPNGPQGTITVADDEVHVGGCTDIHVRGTDFDEATLVLDSASDDMPGLLGIEAEPGTLVTLGTSGFALPEYVLGTSYAVNSLAFRFIERAGKDRLTLQIITGPDSLNLGTYQVIKVNQTFGQAAELQTVPAPPVLDGQDYQWKLTDALTIDLVEPKNTRVSNTDLSTVQHSQIVRSTSGLNFNDFGVAQGDTLRVLTGPDIGDYKVLEAPLSPGFDRLKLDTPIKNTVSNVSYTVFRPNAAGGIDLPLIRATKLELLDSSGQPLGTTIPYAKPVDVQSRAFQNPARGVKHSLDDAELGILSLGFSGGAVPGLAGTEATVLVLRADGTASSTSVNITDNSISVAVSDFNASLNGLGFGVSAFSFTRADGTIALGFRPVGVGLIIQSGSALIPLFGNSEPRSTADIRSATVDALPDTPGPGVTGWDDLQPAMDYTSSLDLAQVIDGNQIGFYGAPYSGPPSTGRTLTNGITAVDTRALVIRDVSVPWNERTRQFGSAENVQLELGSRSLGSARCFFLEPTSVEFNQDSFFYVDTDRGRLRFLPDPALAYQIIPPLPTDNKSNDGSAGVSGTVLTASSQTFLSSGVAAGDQLYIDFVPLTGSIALTDPVPSLAGTSLKFSIDNGPDLTLVFIRDDISLAPDEVSRDGVVAQINAKAGLVIAQLTVSNTLEFVADAKIIIRGSGTSNSLILGTRVGTTVDFTTDQNNISPLAANSPYTVIVVAETALTIPSSQAFGPIAPYTGTTLSRQGFKIRRPGLQRIVTTTMAAQQAEASLYYFDVELVSEGSGDLWNIDANVQLFVDVFKADGYYLTTDDENLTFSTVERPKIVISKSILEQGVDDSPSNAISITGQNLEFSYERSQLVSDVQAFVSAETERVQNENALVRHLIPNFVRFGINYTGGSTEEVVISDIEQYIKDLFPADALKSSDLQSILSNRGATSIENPIDLIAIVHKINRVIQATRSQNALRTGRLSAFVPDVLDIKRNTVI